MTFRLSFLIILLTLPTIINAQIGGTGTYKFLELPSSARIAALGGKNITLRDNDINLALQNPALINSDMANWLAFSITDHFAGIAYGHAAYGMNLGKLGTAYTGMHFIRYGEFIAADPTGQITGTFTAGEYNMNFGLGRSLTDRVHYGGNLKLIYSSLESYNSFGTALDAGITYFDDEANLTISAVVKNAGIQITRYVDGSSEPLPFQIMAGISKKPEHVPFRFHILLHNLQRADLTYINPNLPQRIDLETGEPIVQTIPLSEKIFRHFVFGGEFLLGESFHIRAGYDHQRRQEMGLENFKGSAGFSFGAGIKLSRFHIDYGRAVYHAAGGANHFSLSTNLQEWVKREN